MYNYQSVVFDLDGTLLNSHHQILTENKAVIQNLQSANVDIYLASGRPHQLMLPYAHELGLETPLICCNGAYCFDVKSNDIIHGRPVEKGRLIALLMFCQSLDVAVRIISPKHIYLYQAAPSFQQISDWERQREPDAISTYQQVTEKQFISLAQSLTIYKAVVETENLAALKELHAYCDEHELNFTQSCHTMADITILGTNKAQALRQLLQAKSYDVVDTVAFGNYSNDMELLASAGLGIAMGNSPLEVKEIANIVTTHHDESGIYDSLCLYF
ncbi:HAD family hydrolase [Vibrio cionasavignyae]|uniref:HAD family hydrolase n=1 Tax=Vibrio cionasavignyae TaxID=2910252 RepID=UPI003D0BA464